MITNAGKIHIKRYLAGQVPSIAEAVAFGIGSLPETVAQTSLQFEVDRSEIIITSYDFINDKLVFKAPVPETFDGRVYEVALFSQLTNSGAGSFGSRLISTFDSETEDWVTGVDVATFNSVTARVGGDSLYHNPAASGSTTSALNDLGLDFYDNSSADKFVLAFFNSNSNTASVAIRFKTDASNYYTITVTNPAVGYIIYEITKGAATVTGTPDWGNITSIEVITTAKASGAAAVAFDGIRIEDIDTIDEDYVMVARKVLSAPFDNNAGTAQDIEFTLEVSI